jgi:hypothetical protein
MWRRCAATNTRFCSAHTRSQQARVMHQPPKGAVEVWRLIAVTESVNFWGTRSANVDSNDT